MHKFKEAWVVYIVLVSIIISTSILAAKIYVPFQNIVKIEKMLESKSKVEFYNPNSTEPIIITDDALRVELHNIFNDIDIGRKIIPCKDRDSKDIYTVKFEFTNSENKQVEYLISINNDYHMRINGITYKASSDIYSELQDISAKLL